MKISRRQFVRATAGLAGLGLAACAGKDEAMPAATPQPQLKYEIKSIRKLTERGGQTDWAKHDPEFIAYCRTENDGFFDVWTIRTDGTEDKPLTVDKPGVPRLNNGNPAWHPSGKYIAFQGEKDRTWGDRFLSHTGMGGFCDVWLGRSDGSRFWKLTDLPCTTTSAPTAKNPLTGVLMPKFSHDGKKLHWSQWRTPADRGKFWWSWEIMIADFIDDDENPHLENLRSLRPQPGSYYEAFMFTPDDKKLLVTGTIEDNLTMEQMELYLVDAETAEWENLSNTPNAWEEGAKVSPDGKKVFYATDVGQESQRDPQNAMATRLPDYWIMDIDGSNKKRLTHFNEAGHPDYRPGKNVAAVVSWSPDGTRLSALMGAAASNTVHIIELE